MNPFLQHPHDQGIGYREHAVFALSIACRLCRSAMLFALHGVFPWLPIPRCLDLEATESFLRERNAWIESMGSETGAVQLGSDVLVGQQLHCFVRDDGTVHLRAFIAKGSRKNNSPFYAPIHPGWQRRSSF